MRFGYTRLLFAVFLFGMTVVNVARDNALDAAISSAGAICWLWSWTEGE